MSKGNAETVEIPVAKTPRKLREIRATQKLTDIVSELGPQAKIVAEHIISCQPVTADNLVQAVTNSGTLVSKKQSVDRVVRFYISYFKAKNLLSVA